MMQWINQEWLLPEGLVWDYIFSPLYGKEENETAVQIFIAIYARLPAIC